MAGNKIYASVGHRYLKKKVGHGSENQSISGVTTICLMQRDTSPWHRADQAVDCSLWNGVPLFNSCAKLLGISRNWNMLHRRLSRASQTCSMADMSGEYAGHRIFRFQELRTDACDIGLCIIMLKHDVMVEDKWHDNGLSISSRYLCAFK